MHHNLGGKVMRGITGLAAAGAVTVAVAVVSFILSRVLTVQQTGTSAKAAETVVTDTISSHQIPVQLHPQAPSASPAVFLPPATAEISPIPNATSPKPACRN